MPDQTAPAWQALGLQQVAAELKTDVANGLAPDEVARRQAEYGPNQLTPKVGHGLLVTFLLQFHQPLIYILIAAAAVTYWMEEYIDAGVILGWCW
jgi:cation-transporting P-type ATPase F